MSVERVVHSATTLPTRINYVLVSNSPHTQTPVEGEVREALRVNSKITLLVPHSNTQINSLVRKYPHLDVYFVNDLHAVTSALRRLRKILADLESYDVLEINEVRHLPIGGIRREEMVYEDGEVKVIYYATKTIVGYEVIVKKSGDFIHLGRGRE